jgi:ParB family transcriptional regulator, chromosome partitioning protein
MSFRNDAIFWVEVEKISPNPYQPRREFDEARLKELADSIRQYGVLQPLVVTRKETMRDDGGISVEYELIAGERRLRASRLAGVSAVPVIIRDGAESDKMKLELAIIENLQREDLNAVDRAHAFKQLVDEFGMSHAQVAEKVGRSREYVSNTIRLLMLPPDLLSGLGQGNITEGHARTLLMLNDRPEEQNVLFREILLKKLSVREVERITRKIAADKLRKKEWGSTDPGLIELEKQFTEALGTRVQIAKTDYGGKVVIDYFSPEDLENLFNMVAHSGVRVSHPDIPMPQQAPQVPASIETLAQAEVIGVPAPEEPAEAPQAPVDDRPLAEKKEEDETDLYAIKNFSL